MSNQPRPSAGHDDALAVFKKHKPESYTKFAKMIRDEGFSISNSRAKKLFETMKSNRLIELPETKKPKNTQHKKKPSFEEVAVKVKESTTDKNRPAAKPDDAIMRELKLLLTDIRENKTMIHRVEDRIDSIENDIRILKKSIERLKVLEQQVDVLKVFTPLR